MDETEKLFLRTLDDIENRLTQVDPYEILLISGLIRKLFLDDFPLVDKINQKYKIKLAFEIAIPQANIENDPDLYMWTVQDGLDPDTAPPFKGKVTLNRDQFLRTIVTVFSGHRYSVRDVVLFEANVMGGVHSGSPKTEKETVLHQMESTISVGGYSSSLRQLKAIARVTIKALNPLRIVIS